MQICNWYEKYGSTHQITYLNKWYFHKADPFTYLGLFDWFVTDLFLGSSFTKFRHVANLDSNDCGKNED